MDTNIQFAEIVAGYAQKVARGQALTEEEAKLCAAAHLEFTGSQAPGDDAAEDEALARIFRR